MNLHLLPLLALTFLIAAPLAPGLSFAETPPQVAPPVQTKPFDFADIEQKARKLAAHPYQRDPQDLPEYLAKLDYDHYREIRFREDHSFWREDNRPFQVQLAHRGFLFRDRVLVNLVDGGQIQPVPYTPDLFDFGSNNASTPQPSPPTLGYGGVRLTTPMHRESGFEDFLTFLGASYFRAAGLGQVYGLSARGLAIDTGLAKQEEFPVFREFWLEKPPADASHMVVYALLDSPGVAGAYRFVVRPGLNVGIDVTAHLYFRHNIERLGLAPLTSMFFHGESTERFIDDFRPEAHDSDGLLMARRNGEWTWRPLNNPRHLRISVFQDTNPRGFGLVQRDREYTSYQDPDAQFQNRPSAWVEMEGDWGAGGVHLIEIPSEADKYDNIVAFWVPAQAPQKGQDRIYHYRLHFQGPVGAQPPSARVVASRVGALPGRPGVRHFVVDFSGDYLSRLGGRAALEAEVSALNGKIGNIQVKSNPAANGWRLSFEMEPEENKDPVDLRAFLKIGREILSETWLYQWSAK